MTSPLLSGDGKQKTFRDSAIMRGKVKIAEISHERPKYLLLLSLRHIVYMCRGNKVIKNIFLLFIYVLSSGLALYGEIGGGANYGREGAKEGGLGLNTTSAVDTREA